MIVTLLCSHCRSKERKWSGCFHVVALCYHYWSKDGKKTKSECVNVEWLCLHYLLGRNKPKSGIHFLNHAALC